MRRSYRSLLAQAGLAAALSLGVAAAHWGSAAQAAPPAAQPATPVAKVIFMDKEKACACTKDRVDKSWAALQAALGANSSIPVERLHVDTQAAQAQVYTKNKPLMVPPGIYFVGADGGVRELLQGEITADQVTAALQRRP